MSTTCASVLPDGTNGAIRLQQTDARAGPFEDILVAHPFNKIRGDKVSSSRVAQLTKAYASGGGVKNVASKALASHRAEHKAMHMDDEPLAKRARGGGVKKGGTTIVNVITGGQQQPPAPPPEAMVPPAPPPGPPMPPPGAMAGPPPGAPPMGPGGPPPMPMRARGGGVKSVGMKVGTKVSHDKGKNDLKDIHRPRQVTFATGGGVVSFTANRGPKMPGGAGGAKGRLKKAALTHNGSQV